MGAPFTNNKGDRLAPLGLALETYARNPKGKHAVMEIFARQGYALPDTPMMAFHRGDVERLEDFLRRDPDLVERRFSCVGDLSAGTGLREGWTIRNALDADRWNDAAAPGGRLR